MGVDAPIDITSEERKTVLALLQRHLPGTAAWVYGSRVKWTSRPQSDLDLVVFTTPEQRRKVGDLREAFEASNLPFRVDLFVWDEVPDSFRRRIQSDHVRLVSTSSERNPTPRSWPRTALGKVIDLRLSSVDKKTQLNERYVRLCNYTDVYSNSFIHSGLSFMNGTATDREISNYALKVGDVVITKDSETYDDIGVPALVREAVRDLVCGYHLAILRANPLQLDGTYLFYALSTTDVQQQFHSYANGVTRFGLRKADICLIDIPLPPPDGQRTIGRILRTLDDKIELNRRMNATLETMGRALFKSWFVDFDPVRAKMKGRDTGLPRDIADLFPDRLVESELGGIPLGWPVESLADHFEAVKGVSYKGSGLGGDGVPLHNLNSVHEGGGYKYEGIKFYSGEYVERHLVCPGDVIVANTEQGHERLLIGYAAIVPKLFGGHGIYSHHICRLRPRSHGHLSTPFLHLLLNSPWMHDLVSGYANGTTVNMLPMDALQKPMVVVPPKGLLEAFDALALHLEHRREEAVRDSRTLGVLRDALLPKLVSGELRVNSVGTAYSCDAPSASVGANEA